MASTATMSFSGRMSRATFGFTMQVDEWPKLLELAADDGNDPRKSEPTGVHA